MFEPFEDLDDIFKLDEEKEKDKDKKKKKESKALVALTQHPDGSQTRKPVILVNEYATVGEKKGRPVQAWVNRERQSIAQDVLEAFKKDSNLEIFNVNGYMSTYDPSTKNWYLFDEPQKVLVLIDNHVRLAKRKGDPRNTRIVEPIYAPKYLGDYLIHAKNEIQTLDKVVNVVKHPYFDDNHKIINEPGYNKKTQCYLPEGFQIDPQAHRISLTEAFDIFDNVFGSMNYKAEIDSQAELAAFLTPPWKYLSGNTPIITVNSNVPGSGKGLRQRIYNTIWTDNTSAIISKPRNEDELRKQLFATLRTGIGFLAIDNISDKLLSDTLATYATENYLSDRAVYGRTLETYKNNIILSVNGNNLRLSEDIATRILPIHLQLNESSLIKDYKAEGRKTADEIMKYVDINREKIIGAALRMCIEFINDLMPDHPTGISRFDAWRKYVLGTTYHMIKIKKETYLLNQAIIKSKIDADPESQNRATLFKAILDVIGTEENDETKSKPFITSKHQDCGIFDLASHTDKKQERGTTIRELGHDILAEHINTNASTERSRQTRLGIYIRDKAIDKIHFGWKLIKDGTIHVDRRPKQAYRLILVNHKNYYLPGTENWKRDSIEIENNTQQTNNDNDNDQNQTSEEYLETLGF